MTWLDLFYHELQCLVSPWSLKVLCIYVLRSQKGLARYHHVISYYDCFEKVLSSEFYYYGSLVDYAIDMSKLETYALLWVWLLHNNCWNWRAHCCLHSLLLVYIGFSQSLIFKGALYLCFAVSERASEIPSYYVISWLFWESVVIRDLLLLLASWLCHWYE